MTYFLFANPNSGKQRGRQTVQKVRSYFEENSVPFRLFVTTAAHQEESLLSEILQQKSEQDHLIVIGGDGTLSLVMKYLPAELPFSYLPAGSGNDFARSMGISMDPIEAFKSIQRQEVTDFYVLGYDSPKFRGFAVNNIGIGLDGEIINKANSSHMKGLFNGLHLGSVIYLFTALRVLFKKKGFEVNLGSEQRFDNAFLFTLTKHPYFGGGIKIAPGASNLHEEIVLVEIDKIPQRQFLPLLYKILKVRHESDPRVHQLSQKHFNLKVTSRQAIHIDGEPSHIEAGDELRVWSELRHLVK